MRDQIKARNVSVLDVSCGEQVSDQTNKPLIQTFYTKGKQLLLQCCIVDEETIISEADVVWVA
jgi:hypothetical protein